MPPSDWFQKRGDEAPVLAGESKRAWKMVREALDAELRNLGFESEGDKRNCWRWQSPEGFFVRAIGHYRSKSTLSVRSNYPAPGGKVGSETDHTPVHVVVGRLDDDGWRRDLAAAVATARSRVAELEQVRCPLCESLMVLRTASRGPHEGDDFHGCSQFPECRGFRAPWGTSSKNQADDGDDSGFLCPECGGEMRVRYAKRGPTAGQRFYGCADYPKCDRVVDTEEEATALRLMGDTIAPEKDDDDIWPFNLAVKR